MLNRLSGVVYITGSPEQVQASAKDLVARFLDVGDAQEVGVLPQLNNSVFRARFTGMQLDLAESFSALSQRFLGIEVGAAYEAQADTPLFGACVYDQTGVVLSEAGDGTTGMSEVFVQRFRHFS